MDFITSISTSISMNEWMNAFCLVYYLYIFIIHLLVYNRVSIAVSNISVVPQREEIHTYGNYIFIFKLEQVGW